VREGGRWYIGVHFVVSSAQREEIGNREPYDSRK
jgi:hypothetical protein